MPRAAIAPLSEAERTFYIQFHTHPASNTLMANGARGACSSDAGQDARACPGLLAPAVNTWLREQRHASTSCRTGDFTYRRGCLPEHAAFPSLRAGFKAANSTRIPRWIFRRVRCDARFSVGSTAFRGELAIVFAAPPVGFFIGHLMVRPLRASTMLWRVSGGVSRVSSGGNMYPRGWRHLPSDTSHAPLSLPLAAARDETCCSPPLLFILSLSGVYSLSSCR